MMTTKFEAEETVLVDVGSEDREVLLATDAVSCLVQVTVQRLPLKPGETVNVTNWKVDRGEAGGWLCMMCGLRFDAKASYTAHNYWHQMIEEKVERESSPPPLLDVLDVNEHLEPAVQAIFVCDTDTCHEAFKSLLELQFHKKQHIREFLQLQPTSRRYPRFEPAECTYCGLVLSCQTSLKRHEKLHTGDQPYKCSQCDRSFVDNYRLQAHENIHLGLKPFKCRFCDAYFTTSSMRAKHQTLHSNIRPFHCDQCPANFKQSGHLQRHMLAHMKPTHFCKWCEKGFRRKEHLQMHEKLRRCRQKCEVCAKNCRNQKSLLIHMSYHKEECYMCGFKSTVQGQMQKHLQTHVKKINNKKKSCSK